MLIETLPRRLTAVFVIVVVLTAVLLAWTAKPARACSCSSRGPSVTETYAAAGAVVYGSKTGERIEGDLATGTRVYDFAIDTVVKGTFGPTVEIRTSAAESACGSILQAGRFAILADAPAPDGSLAIELCTDNVQPVEQIEALLGRLPLADGRAPPTVVVRADLGDVSLIATDIQGRPVRWGRAPDLGWDLAPCPGGRKLVAESVGDDQTVAMAVIDAATLEVESRRVITGGPSPAGFHDVSQLQCLDAAGSRSAFTDLHYYDEAPHLQLVVENRGVIEVAAADATDPQFDRANQRVLGRSSDGARPIIAIDLASATVAELLVLAAEDTDSPWAFSPDATRVVNLDRIDPTSPITTGFTVTDLASGAAESISFPDPITNASVSWPDGERILVTSDTIVNPPGDVRLAFTVWSSDGGALGQVSTKGQGDAFLIANAVWAATEDRPDHPAVDLLTLPAGSGRHVLAGAYVFDVVHVIPEVVLGPAPVAPLAVRATPAFTG